MDYAFVSTLPEIIFFSIICNVIAITFIQHKKSRKTLKEKLVFLLCSINLCQTIGYSIELYAAFTGKIQDVACQVQAFVICFSTYTTLGCFVSLTIERYLNIIYPFKCQVWLNDKFKVAQFLLLPILGGFVLGTPPLLGWGTYGKSRKDSTYCGYEFKGFSDRSFFITVVICGFGIPFVMASVCFTRITRELQRTSSKYKRRYGRNASISVDSSKRAQEQEIYSIVTGLVYSTSWVPFSIVCFLFYFNQHVPMALEYVSIFMCKSATITSAILFCLIEKRVRRYTRRKVSEHMLAMAFLPRWQFVAQKRNDSIKLTTDKCCE